jgi:5'(3')-deoxyribonucleotidase
MSPGEKTKVFIDMDGVLVDFISGALEVFSVPYNSKTDFMLSIDTWEDLPRALGVSDQVFYSVMGKLSYEFWLTLAPLRDTDKLNCGNIVRRLTNSNKVETYILTTAVSANSAKGKIMWVEAHLPHLADKVITAKTKAAVSGQGKVLIDDRPRNIEEWEAAGGRGILYPQDYNTDHTSLDRERFYENFEKLITEG